MYLIVISVFFEIFNLALYIGCSYMTFKVTRVTLKLRAF